MAEVSDRACFNTGLLTPGQEEIFGVFTTNENYDASRRVSGTNKKWTLVSWARSGDRILTAFRALPEMASYWSDPGQLVLDPALHVEPNIDHILPEQPPSVPSGARRSGRPRRRTARSIAARSR